MLMSALTSRRANATLVRAIARRAAAEAANDNGNPGGGDFASDVVVHKALRHFAQFGLAAPQEARKRAEQAFFAGNRGDYNHWLEVCRALDRRLAENLLLRENAENGK